MRAVHLLTPADARLVPWKNGRGKTAELAVWPPGSSFERGDFDWRISKARIAEDGIFSRFEEHDRILVVLDGAGVDLSHPGLAPRTRVRALEPVRFRGDWPTEAHLPAGPVADFNVFVRRGAWDASVEVVALGLRRAREPFSGHHAFVHLAHGRARVRVVGEEEPLELSAGDSVWVSEVGGEEEIDLVGLDAQCTFLLTRVVAGPAR